MAKVIELITSKTMGESLSPTLQLTLPTEALKQITMDTLRTAAATLVTGDHSFSLHYTDSDGDDVTLAGNADVKELVQYVVEEGIERVMVLVTPNGGRTVNAVQKQQVRDREDAMAKRPTDAKAVKATVANAKGLLVARRQTMDVAEDVEELATSKQELLTVLEDGELKKEMEELGACDAFKEMADVMVEASYKKDAQGLEEAVTTRLDELLKFAQCLVTRCPTMKPLLVTVAKQCVTGLVRLKDEKVIDDGVDSLRNCSSSSSEEKPVHVGVICDGCEKAPLIGVRYKALELSDFDLCEDCEASGKWVSHEPFIKITDPLRMSKRKCTSMGSARSTVGCDGCQMIPIVGTRFHSKTADNFDLCEACEASGKWTDLFGPFIKLQEPGVVHTFNFSSRGGKVGHHNKDGPRHGKNGHHHGQHGKFSHHGRPGIPHFSRTEEEQREEGRPSRRRGCQGRGRWGHDASNLEARFLEDVSIDDGTVVEAQKPLRKMWKLVNDGERSWPDGCYMITQRGNPMVCEGMKPSRIDLPALARGEEFIAGVDLVAPKVPGRYAGFWRVCDPVGVSFGHRFWIDIEVVGAAVPEATSFEAPTADSVDESETNLREADLVCSSDDDIEIIKAEEAQEAIRMIKAAESGESESKVSAGPNDTVVENTVTDYHEKPLMLLASMGFTDFGKNLRALELADGNVCIAVNALLLE